MFFLKLHLHYIIKFLNLDVNLKAIEVLTDFLVFAAGFVQYKSCFFCHRLKAESSAWTQLNTTLN